MKHADVLGRLSAYLEGDLAPREETDLEVHLAECFDCSAELRALRRALDLLHQLPPAEPSRDLGAAVIERLRAGEGRPPRWRGAASLRAIERRSPAWLLPMALAAGIGALALLQTRAERASIPRLQQLSPIAVAESRARPPLPRLPAKLSGVNIGLSPRPSVGPLLVSTPSCLERSPSGDECTASYAWLVSLALDDPGAFAEELNHLTPGSRESLIHRLSDFAVHSGSAPLVGNQLRSSHDPGAMLFAERFERHSGDPLRLVGFQR